MNTLCVKINSSLCKQSAKNNVINITGRDPPPQYILQATIEKGILIRNLPKQTSY